MTDVPLFEFGSPLDTIAQTGWMKVCDKLELVNWLVFIPRESINDDSVKQWCCRCSLPYNKSTKENALDELESRLLDFKDTLTHNKIIYEN